MEKTNQHAIDMKVARLDYRCMSIENSKLVKMINS